MSTIVSSLPADTRWLVVQFIEVSRTAVGAFARRDDIDAAVQLLRARRSEDAAP